MLRGFLLAVSVVLVATGCGAADRDVAPRAPPGEAAWKSLSSGWTKLPPPPFIRARAVSVWTGAELFYWGGDTDAGGTSHADGATYDPAAREWQVLPSGPLSARSSAGAVWTGTEVLIWGGGTTEGAKGDGASFNPATASWRMLPDAPLEPRDPVAAVWTGREMIVWGDASRSASAIDGAAYDPAGERWRELPPAPLALNEATAVWTGDEMIVYGALLDGNNWSEAEHAQGIAYDPEGNEWRVLPPFPLSPQASTAVWAGDELVVWDYELRAAAYEPATDRWRPLPDLPLAFSECYPQSARAAEDLVFAWHCGKGALFDLKSDTWHVLPGPYRERFASLAAADRVVLFAGAAHEGHANALWAYKPQELGALVFVPRAQQRGERVYLPVTVPDGTSAVLTYPSQLDLAGLGVQPDVSYLYRDNRPPRFPLAFYRGEAPAAALSGAGPIDRFATRKGGEAELWRAPSDADGEDTDREEMPYRLVFRFGSWTVVAPARDAQGAEVLAGSLDGRETPDGFVVLEAFPPIALSDESGEGEGPKLTIGDSDPDPDRLGVNEHFRHVQLEPIYGGCEEGVGELSSSYASLCLGGVLHVGINGDREFVRAVFHGLGAREVRLGSP